MGNNKMQCTQCKFLNPAGATYCSWCGACLTVLCSSCKSTHHANVKVCCNCGEDLPKMAKKTPKNWWEGFKCCVSKIVAKIIEKIPPLNHERDYTYPPVFGGRVILHTFHGLAIAFSLLVHWGLTIAFVWLFIRYEENEDIHARDEAWKDYYGALGGIFIGGVILYILIVKDIVSI